MDQDGRLDAYERWTARAARWREAQVQASGVRLRGGGTRTPVLSDELLDQLGLSETVADLNLVAGRPVSLMLYRAAQDVAARGPSITWPR